MTKLNECGYITHRPGIPGGNVHKSGKKSAPWRNWFMVKSDHESKAIVRLSSCIMPDEYIGKRVRFKVELVDDKPKPPITECINCRANEYAVDKLKIEIETLNKRINKLTEMLNVLTKIK